MWKPSACGGDEGYEPLQSLDQPAPLDG